MKIGNLNFEKSVFLAPMAGVTDISFRGLCKEMGCGLVYTEMVSAKALYYGSENTKTLLRIADEEKPVAAQIDVYKRQSYRRVDSKKQTKKLDFENGLIGLLVVLASGVMISRVGFGFVEGLYLAPFGIGYFLSMVKKSDFKKLLLVYLAVNVGYLIGYSKGKDIIIYVSISTAILLLSLIHI